MSRSFRKLLPLALLGLAASAPAFAQDYATQEVGGWTVAASKDKRSCFLTKSFAGAGDTTLLLGLDIDGSHHLSLLNANWSIKPQEKLKLSFRLSKGGYPNHPVVGMASDGKRGFVTNFDAKFPGHFAASKALHVQRGKVPVEQLDLTGSGAAVAELRRCVALAGKNKGAGARESGRSDKIPKDPFAPGVQRRFRD